MRAYGWLSRAMGVGLGFLLVVGTVLADELLLRSGERLTGTVVSLHDGKMLFKSASLGTIEIERAKIKTFSTDREVKVKDAKGVFRRGKAVSSTDGKVKFEAVFVSGEPAVNTSKVTSFASGEEMDIKEIASIDAVASDTQGVWHGQIMGSVTGTRSTTNTNEVDVNGTAEMDSETGRLSLWGWYEYAVHDREGFDSVGKNNYGGGAQYDFKLQQGWYLFVKGQLQHDEIRQIDREWLLAAGVGKTLYDQEGVHFRLEGGISHVDERFRDFTEDRNHTAGYVGYYLRWNLDDKVSLIHELAWYPAGRDENSIIETFLALQYEFHKNWTLGIRLSDTYHSHPAETADKNKFKYGIYLGIRF